jgi:DNA replication licensing factor MCM5
MNPNVIQDPTHQDIDLATLKQYVAYCKAKCAPRLTQRAAAKLSDHYVLMRSQVHAMEMDSTERSSIPITVRQLEAIIRISESLAKMTLSPVATEEHVDEAIRLFRVSTMQAVHAGHSLEGMLRPELVKEIEKVERVLRARMPIGSSISYSQILRELVNIKGFTESAVVRCIDMMVMQEKLLFRNQRRTLVRQP